jgi:TatA/E family protein of Tat protein translocase
MQVAEIASVEVIMIMAAVGLLVFGSAKLPKIARGLGSARGEFEKGLHDGEAAPVSVRDEAAG